MMFKKQVKSSKQASQCKIKILKVKDFSEFPGPRYITEGENSGEEFRKLYLAPLLGHVIENKAVLHIILDGVAGYGTSFLEEAFGGLIREDGLKYKNILSHIVLISEEEPYLVNDIKRYLFDAYRDSIAPYKRRAVDQETSFTHSRLKPISLPPDVGRVVKCVGKGEEVTIKKSMYNLLKRRSAALYKIEKILKEVNVND